MALAAVVSVQCRLLLRSFSENGGSPAHETQPNMKADEKTGTDGGSTLGALLLAGGMAFLAGATDVYGLSRLRDLFVSFMSGNTTMLGKAISDGDMRRCGVILGIIGCFTAGAAAGTVLAEWTGRRHPAAVGFLVAILLAAGTAAPAWETALIVLAMGALNASMTQVGQASVSLTYVTGTLVKIGQEVGKAVCGKGQGFGWALQGAMWLFLLAGATTGAALLVPLQPYGTWPLAALALLLSGVAFACV
jgi:uncharacterized membrane protein YoaK (UPF0700 family)